METWFFSFPFHLKGGPATAVPLNLFANIKEKKLQIIYSNLVNILLLH